MWIQDGEDVLANVKRMTSSKKAMLSADFSRTGFVSIDLLPQGQKYNSQFFTETILPSLIARLFVHCPKLKVTAAHLHLDNAKSHHSRLSIEKMEESGFIHLPKPPYSPDLAPCDFFLFGYLKFQLEGKTFFDEDSVIEEVRRILMEIPVNLLHSVRAEWIQRLR
jgi:histone-lysine N-methyltransferase SETMAR